MALFEGYERRMPQLQPVLEKYWFKDFDELKAYNNARGVDAYKIVEGIQPIAFEIQPARLRQATPKEVDVRPP